MGGLAQVGNADLRRAEEQRRSGPEPGHRSQARDDRGCDLPVPRGSRPAESRKRREPVAAGCREGWHDGQLAQRPSIYHSVVSCQEICGEQAFGIAIDGNELLVLMPYTHLRAAWPSVLPWDACL